MVLSFALPKREKRDALRRLEGLVDLSWAFRARDGEDEHHMDVLEASQERSISPSNLPFLAPHFDPSTILFKCWLQS